MISRYFSIFQKITGVKGKVEASLSGRLVFLYKAQEPRTGTQEHRTGTQVTAYLRGRDGQNKSYIPNLNKIR